MLPRGSSQSGEGDNRGTMEEIGESGHSLNRCAASGQGQNRTADTRIFSPLLYQLSYLAEPMQEKNLAGWVGRWECQCLPLFALLFAVVRP